MRIAAYVHGYPGADDYNRDYTEVFHRLAGAGHEVTVLGDERALSRVPDAATEKVRVISTLRGDRSGIANGVRAAAWMRANARSFDVVMSAGWWDATTHFLSRAALSADVPAVLAPWASLNPHALDRRWTRHPKRASIALLDRWYGRRKPVLQLYAPSDVSHVERLGLGWDHFLAPLGLYEYEPPSPSLDWSTLLGTSRASPRRVLVFNARLDLYQKGYDVLLQGFAAASRQRGARFRTVLVISGRPAQGGLAAEAETARRLAEPLVAQGIVVYLGEVSSELRRDMIAHGDAFIYPSRVDGPPRPLREALSRSTPILATPETGFAHWIEEYGAGLAISAPSAEAVAAAVAGFDSAPDEILARWREGAARLGRRLDWSHCYRDYEAGLADAVRRWRQAPA